jgi:AGZA family xanthine/uracil permease-like MFS transporter
MSILKYFSYNKTSQIKIKNEINGGIVNFMAISYIIMLNPVILNANGTGFPINPTITATILAIVISTLIASLFIRLPFILAPGMGLNAYVGYMLASHMHLPIPTILGVIFYSSIILFIFSITNLRQKIINAIPEVLQQSLSVGIGLLLILIGLKNVGIVVGNSATLLSINNKINIEMILCFITFIIASTLFIRGKVYALLLPIILTTLISILLGTSKLPKELITTPDFSLFYQIDFINSLQLTLIPVILSLFIVNFFDATSSVLGLLSQLKYNNKEEKEYYFKKTLTIDACGGIISSIAGTSPNAIFVESSVGIHSGAKTGFSSFITALLTIPFIFLSNLISIVPSCATSPILILVGMLMVKHIKNINSKKLEDLISATFTIIMMPLCFSITAGAVFGIISYTLLKICLGKINEISFSLLIISIGCCGWFFLK